MLEFTGERVIPGLADANLFNEHRARYRFAARFAKRTGRNAAVLDAGCGTGYGAAEFAGEASTVTAIDISGEAVRYAHENFARPGVRFLQAACERLPFEDASFDLIAAFEVIEHLERWPEMLSEARRVLKPEGILLVSTPNKAYYSESRAQAGPNPFHVREFEYAEFRAVLQAVFPHVRIWSQNHSEAIAFVPPASASGALDCPDDQAPDEAHFFVAACGRSPWEDAEAFAYLPQAGNILRERERHIALLQRELEQKTRWLSEMEERHSSLNRAHGDLLTELHERTLWAARLNGDLQKSGARVVQLQEEYVALEQEMLRRLDWVKDLDGQIERGRCEIARLVAERDDERAVFEERVNSLRAETARAEERLAQLEASRWMRLGRAVRLGPDANPTEAAEADRTDVNGNK